MTWKRPISPTPKKIKPISAAGKIKGCFWDSQGLVMIEYRNHGATIWFVKYANDGMANHAQVQSFDGFKKLATD
ncbi:unnamed protein product [Pieris macdunnoughi]|uniref:Uncharacterized protein n=1 Tax=Pieris macdunnoughi TaxID=345717 RepID=A0A821URS6_9NEOP|nr:unnamed protein product [Pieris macdunnoughi]